MRFGQWFKFLDDCSWNINITYITFITFIINIVAIANINTTKICKLAHQLVGTFDGARVGANEQPFVAKHVLLFKV